MSEGLFNTTQRWLISEIIHFGCEDKPFSVSFPPSHICHVHELHSHGLKQSLKTAPVLIWGLLKAEPELRTWGDPRRQESEAGEKEEEQRGEGGPEFRKQGMLPRTVFQKAGGGNIYPLAPVLHCRRLFWGPGFRRPWEKPQGRKARA